MAGNRRVNGVTLYKRLRLFFLVVAVVVALSLIKAAIHWAGLEFLVLNPLFTSAIAGAIFIIGFLLSSVLADYKEAERLPVEMRVALEGIRNDISSFAQSPQTVTMADVETRLTDFVVAIERGPTEDDHSDLTAAVSAVDNLSFIVTALEKDNIPANYIVRLRGFQDVLRRSVFRIAYIQRMQFVPSAYVLVQTLVASIMFLLLFLKTEGSPESALIFGFISYMFIYALYLISTLEQPFRKGHDSVDDVSLFLLREFAAAKPASLAKNRRGLERTDNNRT